MEFIKLEKGKLLDVQVGFVDSWNRMVDCWNNLSGEGKAEVLWRTENHPVVKVEDTGDPSGGDNDDDDDDEEPDLPDIIMPPYIPKAETNDMNGCYEILSILPSSSAAIIQFANPYYSIGGKVYSSPYVLTTDLFPCVVALSIDTAEGDATLEVFSTIQDLIEECGEFSKYLIPLYSFTAEKKKAIDFRNMPRASMGEF